MVIIRLFTISVMVLASLGNLVEHYHYHFATKMMTPIDASLRDCMLICQRQYPMIEPINWTRNNQRSDCMMKCKSKGPHIIKVIKIKRKDVCENECKAKYTNFNPLNWFKSDERKICITSCMKNANTVVNKAQPVELGLSDKCLKICEKRNHLWDIWHWTSTRECLNDCANHILISRSPIHVSENPHHKSYSRLLIDPSKSKKHAVEESAGYERLMSENISGKNHKNLNNKNNSDIDNENNVKDADNQDNKDRYSAFNNNKDSKGKKLSQHVFTKAEDKLRKLLLTCEESCKKYKKKVFYESCLDECEQSTR